MKDILGILFATMVGAIVMPKYMQNVSDSNENLRMVATAQQQKEIYKAGAKYMELYANTLQSTATATTPAIITVPMLQSVKLLDASISAANPYQQTWQVQVLQPTPGYLQALVTSVNGEILDDKKVSKIASLVGRSGGFIPRNDSGTFTGATQAEGAFGGWKLSTANYSTAGGHPAALLTVAAGQIENNHLYRNAVPGQPQLNQMNTALGLNGNDINGVGTLRGKAGEFSRDGNWACCNPNGQTLSLSEDTQNTGRKPTIQFHSGGANEGYIELAGLNEPRRLNLKDNQGAGLGLNATGTISAPRLELPAGQNFKAGAMTFENDGWTTRLRQPGNLYIEHNDGSVAGIDRVAHINASGDINAANNVKVRGVIETAQQWWSMIARDGNGADNASAKDAAGSLYVNDIYIRSAGKWASEMGSGPTGAYIENFGGVGTTGDRYNSTGRTLIVMASGGYNDKTGKTLSCSLVGSVGGGDVIGSVENNPAYAKSCAITFAVPPNTTYSVRSLPWDSGNGYFSVNVYRM